LNFTGIDGGIYMQLPINIRDFKGQITSKHQKIAGWLKIFILIIIVTAIGSGFVFNNREKPIPVNVIKVKSESIEKVVFTSGRLEAADEQEFFTAVDSTLMDLNVKVGDRVNKGEILGRLDTLELERRYKEAVASLAGKEAELAKAAAVNENLNLKALHSEYLMTRNKMNRIEELLKAGAASLGEKEAAQAELDRVEAAYLEARTRYNQGASVKQYDSLQAQVELARQEMNQASERLDMATFVAMSNGVVTYIGAQKGNRVMEGSLLLVVGSDRE
jgi:HlyD family secretion protein